MPKSIYYYSFPCRSFENIFFSDKMSKERSRKSDISKRDEGKDSNVTRIMARPE